MSRAAEIGAALGLDVEGSRRRHAAARVRYRAAISRALDRLLELEAAETHYRAAVPYASAGMSHSFERREMDGRGENQDQAPTSGADRTTRNLDRRVADPRAAGDRRTVPVPVRVPAA